VRLILWSLSLIYKIVININIWYWNIGETHPYCFLCLFGKVGEFRFLWIFLWYHGNIKDFERWHVNGVLIGSDYAVVMFWGDKTEKWMVDNWFCFTDRILINIQNFLIIISFSKSNTVEFLYAKSSEIMH
jgi:hypothetical protein